MYKQLKKYERNFKNFGGWFKYQDYQACAIISDFLECDNNIRKIFLEIGVHHGKSFIPFTFLLRDKVDLCIAIDVFEEQERNIDHSGQGDCGIFENNLQKYGNPEIVKILKEDSTRLTGHDLLKYGHVLFASIDGGHTYGHTTNDLRICTEALDANGIIMIDDVFNKNFCEVSWGLSDFLHQNPEITPFCIGFDKVFLCKSSAHDKYIKEIGEKFKDKFFLMRKRYFGSDIIIYGSFPRHWRYREHIKEKYPGVFEYARNSNLIRKVYKRCGRFFP